MTNPRDRRYAQEAEDPYPADPEKRQPDPGKATYYAYPDPDATIEHSDQDATGATDGVTTFEKDGGDRMPETVPADPPSDGVGPISTQFLGMVLFVLVIIGVFIVAALLI